ncbi:MAG: hypothetical protein ABW007_22870 [Chitinophagaceae bacterium]
MTDILHYKGYYASIHFNSEENIFYGKVQGIADTIMFDASSLKELKAAFLEAVEAYIDNKQRSTNAIGDGTDATNDITP